MLSRRQLRIKVLQALYAFFQAEKTDLAVAERELFRSIDKVHELYVYVLLLLKELAFVDQTDADDLHLKFFPKEEELNAKIRLHELKYIQELENNAEFAAALKRTKLSWQSKQDLVRKLYLEIKKSEEYRSLLTSDQSNEKDFLCDVIRKFFLSSEALQHEIEEENIFWLDDFDFVCHMIIRGIKAYYETGKLEIMPLYKDEEDDRLFVRTLFSKTIVNNDEYEKAISERTKNWEIDRIALMDILILKMALSELVNFPGIPVKVSINEYIDISKEYSTPKSKQFVNGVIDKLALDYKEQGKIVKTGRGLIG
ncbi:MAG TPA: transcription antitermination factor NusB [Bacteroidia bacterium]|nr:transcription antitermination factor NusB [Bacteroidia bacterium]